MDSARVADPAQEGPLVDYLAALSAGRHFDLVIPIGGPAVQFAPSHRQVLLPGSPMLISSTDERHVRQATLLRIDAVVALRFKPSCIVQSILDLLPQTTNVVVVVSASPAETFWLREMRGRVHLLGGELDVESALGHGTDQRGLGAD